MGKLWLAMCVLIALLTSQGRTQDSPDCPKECMCKPQMMNMVMRCKTLPLENKAKIPISHFEIIHSDQPLLMKENVFASIGLKKVSSITISNSSVLDIERGAFKELKLLTDVKITHTNISGLHPDMFENNVNLKKLNLANNPFNELDSFVKSASIEELDMSNCNLTTIGPNIFKNLNRLTTLNLGKNNIKQLVPGTFDSLEDIEEIHLEGNQITELPEGIFANNADLENLYLDNNPLSTFSGKMLSNLNALSLRSCGLKALQRSMFTSMDQLTNLDLSNNDLKNIDPGTLTDLVSLTLINLSGNDLLSLPVDVFINNLQLEKVILDDNKRLGELPKHGFRTPRGAIYNVYQFSCRNCGLKSLSEGTFTSMPLIVTLVLSHNSISDVRTGVFHRLRTLTELDLSHNQISTLDDTTFANNIKLHKLNLAGNPLKALHASTFLKNSNLQILDLSDCGLFELWAAPKHDRLNSLLSLNISHNRIKLVTPEDVQVTDGLKSLDLSGNELTCSDAYKSLVDYLIDKDIQNDQYITHERMAYTFEEQAGTDAATTWRQQASAACPNISFDVDPDADIDDDIDDDLDEDSEIEDEYDDHIEPKYKPTEHTDIRIYDMEYDDDVEETPMYLAGRRANKYSYLWLILVFLGAALATLGIVANAVLFVVRRRQRIQVPRIVSVRSMSRLKKNSGLVYQQLSEERDGAKTPVLSRFIPVPSVHQPNAPHHV